MNTSILAEKTKELSKLVNDLVTRLKDGLQQSKFQIEEACKHIDNAKNSVERVRKITLQNGMDDDKGDNSDTCDEDEESLLNCNVVGQNQGLVADSDSDIDVKDKKINASCSKHNYDPDLSDLENFDDINFDDYDDDVKEEIKKSEELSPEHDQSFEQLEEDFNDDFDDEEFDEDMLHVRHI